MKKQLIFLTGLLIVMPSALLNAMGSEEKKDETKKIELKFVAAQPGEDLARYRDILVASYLKLSTPEKEEALIESIGDNFPVLVSWIGNKGHFIKVLNEEKPVGFITFENLNEDGTKIALHASPVLPAYARTVYGHVLSYTKETFPEATHFYTACSDSIGKMNDIIKAYGFEPDDSYQCTQELIINSSMTSYSQALK